MLNAREDGLCSAICDLDKHGAVIPTSAMTDGNIGYTSAHIPPCIPIGKTVIRAWLPTRTNDLTWVLTRGSWPTATNLTAFSADDQSYLLGTLANDQGDQYQERWYQTPPGVEIAGFQYLAESTSGILNQGGHYYGGTGDCLTLMLT